MADRTEDKYSKEKQSNDGIYGSYYFDGPEETDAYEANDTEDREIRFSEEDSPPDTNMFFDEEPAKVTQKKKMITRAEFERRLAEKRRSRKKKRVVFFTALCAFLAVVICLSLLGPKVVSSLMRKAGVKVDMQYIPVTSDVQYAGGEGAVVTYSSGCLFVFDNGVAACHDMTGGFLWDYDLKDVVTPAILTFRDCVIVYDTEGTVVCALGKNGVIWEKRLGGDIDGVFYNRKAGVAAVVYNRDGEMYKSAVDVFAVGENGTVKDLFTKNYTSQYILAAAVSDDGKSLAVSGISAESGDVTGIISLVSVQSGENYYTKHTDSSVYPYVGFVSDSVLAAAGADELLYVKNVTSVESAAQPDNTTSIRKNGVSERMLCVSVPVSDLCIAVSGSGDGASTAFFRNAAGASVKEVSFENSVAGIASYEKNLVLYTSNEIFLTDTSGKILGKCDTFSDVYGVVMMDETHVLVSHGRGVSIVEFSEAT